MAIAAPQSTNGQTPSISELDPLEPIPPDRFETIVFPARDGLTLNFKHLPPASGTAGEPLLMVAGTGTRANLWNPPSDCPFRCAPSRATSTAHA